MFKPSAEANTLDAIDATAAIGDRCDNDETDDDSVEPRGKGVGVGNDAVRVVAARCDEEDDRSAKPLAAVGAVVGKPGCKL